jgi:hypothetical protein
MSQIPRTSPTTQQHDHFQFIFILVFVSMYVLFVDFVVHLLKFPRMIICCVPLRVCPCGWSARAPHKPGFTQRIVRPAAQPFLVSFADMQRAIKIMLASPFGMCDGVTSSTCIAQPPAPFTTLYHFSPYLLLSCGYI